MSPSITSQSLSLAAVDSTLTEEWSELLRATAGDLSMSPRWFASTVAARRVESRAEVFTVRQDTRLVAVIPYVRREEGFFGIRAPSREVPGSFLVAYHPEVIASIEVETVLELLCAQAVSDTAVLVLPNIERSGRTAQAAHSIAAARRLPCRVRPGHISPYLSIHGDWDQFISSKNKKFRYKVRTGITDLQAAGTVSERWFDTAAVTEEFLTDMLSIEAHSWKAPVGMAVRAQEMQHEYYRLLLPFLAAQRALQANVMYLDSIPVAYSLCYLSHGRARQLKTSFDERFASLSPGAVAHQHSIKRAFEIGATEFDFLGDVMPHKTQWATAVREHESIYLFLPNWRGRIVGRARQLVHRLRTRIQ